ncbi:hypothetical protein, partial [Corynebacterium glyciniphilum]|uniref:hypothetical protein n=1 Tax=Corynebacterium glyciniphilum TaxID=1404244 RepID=UPI001C92D611
VIVLMEGKGYLDWRREDGVVDGVDVVGLEEMEEGGVVESRGGKGGVGGWGERGMRRRGGTPVRRRVWGWGWVKGWWGGVGG